MGVGAAVVSTDWVALVSLWEAPTGLNKAALSTIWQPNKSWSTMAPSADNIKGYFLSLIAPHAKHNLNKAVLIIGSAPGHPVNFKDHADM
jgi:hypothetical protein